MNLIKWRPMQGESGKRGEVLVTIWKSKKVAWHWIALYRYAKDRQKTGLRTTYMTLEVRWNWRGHGYSLMFMEWVGFPRTLRWFRP